MGWDISTDNGLLGFDAKLRSVTSTNAELYFNPAIDSKVLNVDFGLVLLVNQPGMVRLIYVGRHITTKCIIFVELI